MISSAEINHVFFFKTKEINHVSSGVFAANAHDALCTFLWPACVLQFVRSMLLSLSSSAADRVTLYMALVTASSARSYISPSDESTMALFS